jgi:hypothetical protein
MNDKLGDNLDEFFKNIGGESEFTEKVTGYCVVYAPLACVFIETQDEEFLE